MTMHDAHDAVVGRLSGFLSCEIVDPSLNLIIAKCEHQLLDRINHKKLPDGLFFTLVDMAVGQYLYEAKISGTLSGLDALKFTTPAKSITEGDVKVEFGGQSDGVVSAEARFDTLVEELRHPDERVLDPYRRMRW